MEIQEKIEAVGSKYDAEQMLVVRKKTWAALREIAAGIAPGMMEEDAVEWAKDVLAEHGMLRGWHGVYVRFGANTVKSWNETSAPGVVLGENDIFFIDIGPTWKDWEGDGADTFVVGTNDHMARCAADARAIFQEVRQRWLDSGDTGRQLYDYARAVTERRGWVLNLDLSGHRLADFPHAATFEGTMADIEFRPSSRLWVLEIHIRHPQQAYGAYFEDLLLSGEHSRPEVEALPVR